MFAANGWDPADVLTAHKEYAAGRKFDPDDIAMPSMRADVAALMTTPLRLSSTPTFEEPDVKFFRVVIPGPDGPDHDPNIYGHTDTQFLQTVFGSPVREAVQVEWDFTKQRLAPRVAA